MMPKRGQDLEKLRPVTWAPSSKQGCVGRGVGLSDGVYFRGTHEAAVILPALTWVGKSGYKVESGSRYSHSWSYPRIRRLIHGEEAAILFTRQGHVVASPIVTNVRYSFLLSRQRTTSNLHGDVAVVTSLSPLIAPAAATAAVPRRCLRPW